MSRFFLAFLISVGSLTVFSQEQHYGSFHLTVEPFLFQNKELLINGTTHSNLGYSFTAEWQRRSPENHQEAGLEFTWVRPKSSLEPAALSIFINIDLHYTLLFALVDRNDWVFYAGGNLRGSFRTIYYPLWDDSHVYWATFSGLSAQCLTRKKMNERKFFFAGFSLPLIGFNSRPPEHWDYKAVDSSFGNIVKLNFQDPGFAYFANYFCPDVTAGFELLISGKFSLAFFLHFEYLVVTASQSEKYQEMRKGIGIDFIF